MIKLIRSIDSFYFSNFFYKVYFFLNKYYVKKLLNKNIFINKIYIKKKNNALSKLFKKHNSDKGYISLKENNFSPDEPCQTFWSSAVIKDNKDTRIHEMAKELMELILNSGYRDQHWLPYLLSKYKISYKIINKEYGIFNMSGVYFSKNYLESV
jgi:hypothetical protein